MPAIKVSNQATSTNALALNSFRNITRPTLLSLYAAGVTVTDTLSLSCGQKQLVILANPNIEIAADVVDTDRDMILHREPLPMGELSMPVTVTTATNFLIILEEVG